MKFTVVHLSGDSGRITDFALNRIKPSQNNCPFYALKVSLLAYFRVSTLLALRVLEWVNFMFFRAPGALT
jgi:hypothetical protein